MLGALVFGVAFLVGVVLILRWYVDADTKAVVRALKWAGLSLVMALVAWLALSGRLWAALVALPAVLMWFVRLFTGLGYLRMLRRLFGLGGTPGWSPPGGTGGTGGGASSNVRTRFLDMTLDHASGRIAGEVLEGRFQGRALDDLSLEELFDLWTEAQGDADSVRLLEAYLDRRMPRWREHRQKNRQEGRQEGRARSGAASGNGIMSRAEALRVLGLSEGAGPDQIKAAHRRLMAQVHPDHGGTDYLAQQINRARDVLLEP